MLLIVIGAALAAIAGVLVWRTASRWWHYVVIAIVALALFPPIAMYLTGDVSRYLPHSAFSEPDAKDQIVIASAYATIMLSIILAAAGFWIVRTALAKRC